MMANINQEGWSSMKIFKRSLTTYASALVFFLLQSSLVFAESGGGAEEGMSHHINTLVFQLSVILVAAWAGGRLFKQLKFPSVLGELVSGVLIGPYALGAFSLPGFPHGIFPLTEGFPVSLELYSIATIASIILLFLTGLETDLSTFLRFSVAGSVVGISGVVFSFVAGDAVGVLLMNSLGRSGAGFFDPVPLFLGVISTATSVGISARILSDKRRLNSPEGVTILAAAVIDDVLGIIVLAIIIGLVKTHTISWAQISLISAKAIGMWGIFTFLGIRYANQIGGTLKRMVDRNMIAIIALAMAFFLAGIFEKSGLAMIIGAYVMGLSLSKTDLSFLIQEKLDSVQRLLVPVFFCVMGMLINVHEMTSPIILKFGLIYITAAIFGKVVGCSLPALFLNFNRYGALRIGVGMVPRGEVALIVAGIGLSMGIIDDKIFGLAIMMTFVTTLLTPPVFDRLLSAEWAVLRKKIDMDKDQTMVSFKMPNAETAALLLSLLIPAFEEEGFYVHSLEGSEKFYHIRKDRTSMTLRYLKHDFIFDCSKNDVVFIHTLFYEVIAQVGAFMRRLEDLTDKRDIGRNILQADSADPAEVKHQSMENYLSPMAVEVALKGHTKDEILREMVGLLVRANTFSQSTGEKIVREVIDRERMMSTGMQDGVALPHVKTELVDQIRFAVGIKKEGIHFDSLDHKPAHIFFLTIAPKKGHESYLQHLAEMSKFLSVEENRQKLVEARNNTDLFSTLIKGL
jgi:Kef-type K+ transport system membrane component KefB/mannitol/fructose-specific phosphotransferase system IIA component (Ntr-type)